MSRRGDVTALVAAAVAGQSLAAMAGAAGVSVSTVQRRLREPEIADAIRDARAQQRMERLGQLNELGARAVERLGQLLDAEQPVVALRAISLVLTTVIKLDPVVDLEERLTTLENVTAEQEARHDHE